MKVTSISIECEKPHERVQKWLHYKSPLQSEYDRFAIDLLKIQESDVILDDGAGNGRFSLAINSTTQSTIIAIEINATLARAIQATVGTQPIHIVRADMTHLPIAENKIDKAICLHNLWYVKPFQLALYEMHRVLKPKGICVFDHLNAFDSRRLLDWKFYAVFLRTTLLRKGLLDLGRSSSKLIRVVKRLSWNVTIFSLSEYQPLRITVGRKFFARRFTFMAAKN